MSKRDGGVLLEAKKSEDSRQLVLYDAPVACLQYFVLNIIYNEKKILPWLYCNYIQLEWLDDWCISFSVLQDYYVGYPYIDKQILIRDTFDNMNMDIVDFLISNIDQGWYTHLCLDDYYIPNKYFYNKEHIPHESMFCGYDKRKQVFTIFGYSVDGLKITKATFDEVRTAYHELGKIIYPEAIDSLQHYNIIFMIKKNMGHDYILDVEYLRKSLTGYLNSSVYAENFRMIRNILPNKTYGMKIYDKLIHEFQMEVEKTITDIRLLTTVYEHKEIMAMRVGYLMETDVIPNDKELLSDFLDIKDIALKMKKLQLYYFLGKSKRALRMITDSLLQLQEKEYAAINQLLTYLDESMIDEIKI